ncbi:MAG: FlgO family outer membrane protein [Nitrospirota bacterium]
MFLTGSLKGMVIFVVATLFVLSNSQSGLAYEKEIKEISSTIAKSIATSGTKTIAVVDFTDLQGNVTELGRFLSEELSIDLITIATGFEVIDRNNLNSVMAEHKLSLSGLVDPKTIKQLGQIAGVDAIITGCVIPFGDSIRLSAKVILTDTAKVIGATKGDIAKTKAIEELLARGIETRQPFGQNSANSQPAVSEHVPFIGKPNSKKIGDMVISMKKIVVSKDKIIVSLDFLSQTDKVFMMAIPYEQNPQLLDDKGNSFSYDGRCVPVSGWGTGLGVFFSNGNGLTLSPKGNSDIVLIFNNNTDSKSIGSVFMVALRYSLYNKEDNSLFGYNVSFSDIKM